MRNMEVLRGYFRNIVRLDFIGSYNGYEKYLYTTTFVIPFIY